jgi:hypothetical protein
VGGTTLGDGYGRLAALPRPDLGVVGLALSWAVPLVLIALLVAAARKKHGAMHPALRQLTGSGT